LAAILNFRHEVASEMIAGHSDVSHVINPCIALEATCVSVKPTKLLLLPVIWLQSWISIAHIDSHDIGSTTTRKADPENIVAAVGIFMLYVS